MSIFGGNGSQPMGQEPQRAVGVRFQKSSYGVPIPMLWGKARCAGNILWYGNFRAIPHTTSQPVGAGGKNFGGGGAVTNTTYTYEAGFIFGLPEGPIDSIEVAWKNKNRLVERTLVTITEAEETHVINGSHQITVTHGADFKADRGVFALHQQRSSDSDGTVYRIPLAIPYRVNKTNGVYTFPATASLIGKRVVVQYSWVSLFDNQTALERLRLILRTGSSSQNPWSFLSTNFPGEAINYRGQSYVAGDNVDLGTDDVAPNLTFEVQSQGAFGGPNDITGVALDEATEDALCNEDYGAGFPSSKIGNWTQWHNFACAYGFFADLEWSEQQPAAVLLETFCKMGVAEPFFSEGLLKIVPYGDTGRTANGVTYTPDNTSVVVLTDDDILPDGDNDPIKVTRKDPSDKFNVVQVEFLNRARSYNVDVAEAKDQASIEDFGVRPASIIKAHGIVDKTSANQLAQQYLNREQNVCNEYSFKLSERFGFLEPMDLVTIPDPTLTGNLIQVRLLELSEDKNGVITVERAEEVRDGVSDDADYDTQTADGYGNDVLADPGDVNVPFLVDAPQELSKSGGPEVWAAVSGSDPNWGGCDVYISTDLGASYVFMGRHTAQCRTGYSTTDITKKKDPDSSNVLGIDLSESGTSLTDATQKDANKALTLFVLGNEFMAYRDASLVGGNTYNLSYLRRGLYNTPISKHPVDTKFARLDSRLFKWAYPYEMLGRIIYMKFCSFNIYGQSTQDISTVSSYLYRLAGPWATVSNPVTGLEIFNQGNDRTFAARDCKFAWRENSISTAPEIGSETYGAGSGQVDPFFSHYLVEIWDKDNTVRRRQETVTESFYTYTWEKNAEDSATKPGAQGVPVRRFIIKVWQVNKFGGKSVQPAMLKVVNSQPVLSSPPVLTGIPGGFQYSFGSPVDTDFAGVKVYASLTKEFTPDDTTLKKNAGFTNDPSNSGQITGLYSGVKWFVRVLPYDVFGDGEMSEQFSVRTKLLSDDGDMSNEHRLGYLSEIQDESLSSIFGFTAFVGLVSFPCYAPANQLVFVAAANSSTDELWFALIDPSNLTVVTLINSGINITGSGEVFEKTFYIPKTNQLLAGYTDGVANYLLFVDPSSLDIVDTIALPYNSKPLAFNPTTRQLLLGDDNGSRVTLRTFDVDAKEFLFSRDMPSTTEIENPDCACYLPTNNRWVVSLGGTERTYFVDDDLKGTLDSYLHTRGGLDVFCGTSYCPVDNRIWVAFGNFLGVGTVDVLRPAATLVVTFVPPTVKAGSLMFCPLNNIMVGASIDDTLGSEFITFSPTEHEIIADGSSAELTGAVSGMIWVPSVQRLLSLQGFFGGSRTIATYTV